MKTISDHPLLIGQILARAAQRQTHRPWYLRLLSPPRPTRSRIVRLGDHELFIIRDR